MTNPTIRRLDWTAGKLGLELTKNGNTRSFTHLPSGRIITYRPGGKGVLRVESAAWGHVDAVVVTSIERVERLMRSAVS